MDMNNARLAEIIAANINSYPIEQAVDDRTSALCEQMGDEAAAQFKEDMSAININIKAVGDVIEFSSNIDNTYLINYLKNHSVPVAGGDGGIAHDVDGSIYHSIVNPKFWGNELESLNLPIFDAQKEVDNILSIMSQDATEDGADKSIKQIESCVLSEANQKIDNAIGGGLS